jgi:superfamily II DNA or RNA helicase
MASREPFFRRHRKALELGLEDRPLALRRAQTGALWALGSHWTVSQAPAQIIIPTGVGKTLIISGAPFMRDARRVLVVAPGRVVRDQLAEALTHFADLKRARALPADLPEPTVVKVEGRATRDRQGEWRSADVVVGNIHNLSPHYDGVDPISKSMFDLVLVDEGHHVPAEAWRQLLSVTAAPAAFFTATPFRRDRRKIPGEVIYAYPLRQAIADGVYRPVTYRPVEPNERQPKDVALAEAAVARLRAPEHAAAGSKLFVRTNRVESAKELVALYKREGANVGLVLGAMSWRQVRETLAKARTGTLDGIVCVGSLVEGFDMPALRIAAYHEPHRTLAPTLQFIGRLSRPGLDVDGELLAVPGDVGEETEELYREEPAWRDLLPSIVDAAVEEERQVRRYVADAVSGGPLDLPALAIRPARSARIFRVDPAAINLNVEPRRLGYADVDFRFFSPESDLVAFVTRHRQRPRWLHADVLDAWWFELHLACVVRQRRLLFIASEEARCLRDLKLVIGAQTAPPIDGEDLRQLIWQIAPNRWFSIGMRPTRPGGTSYENVLGRQVENELSDDRVRAHSLGHGMGGGGTSTFGFSVDKAKLWEPEATESLLDFRRWCEERAEDLLQLAAQRRGLPGIRAMSVPRRFEVFPEQLVVACQLERTLITDLRFVEDGDILASHELELTATVNSPKELQLELAREGTTRWLGLQNPSGDFVSIAGDLRVLNDSTGEIFTMDEAFVEFPPIVWFADGSTIQGRNLDEPRTLHRAVSEGLLDKRDWPGVDVRREVGEPVEGKLSVQGALAQELAERHHLVLTDHGGGELADLIGAAPRPDGFVTVEFVHCKAAKTDRSRRNFDDIAEVLIQAARSARWADPVEGLWAEVSKRFTSRPSACRLLYDPRADARATIEAWALQSPPIRVSILAVQPGLDVDRVEGWAAGESLINLVELWCHDAGAQLRLVGS